MTAEELYALPGHERYERINGEPRERPLPNPERAFVRARFAIELGVYSRQSRSGVALVERSFRIRSAPERMFIPDVAFVQAER